MNEYIVAKRLVKVLETDPTWAGIAEGFSIKGKAETLADWGVTGVRVSLNSGSFSHPWQIGEKLIYWFNTNAPEYWCEPSDGGETITIYKNLR